MTDDSKAVINANVWLLHHVMEDDCPPCEYELRRTLKMACSCHFHPKAPISAGYFGQHHPECFRYKPYKSAESYAPTT